MKHIPTPTLSFNKKSLLSEFLGLDAKDENLGLSHEEQARKTHVKGEIEVLASLEDIFWGQKSCAQYVKERDNNTQFFHSLVNSHRKVNHINSIEVDGVLYKDESGVHS